MNEISLNRVLTRCLEKFPELQRPKLVVEWNATELSGGWGHDNDGPVLLLIIPTRLRSFSASILRPIIFHELAHALNLEHPDEIFYERVDPLCVDLWKRMQADGLLSCSHPEEGQDK